MEMARHLCAFAVIGALLATISGTGSVLAQKAGGVLKIYHRDSPASMSILEEATNSTEIPMMGVFNYLVGIVRLSCRERNEHKAGWAVTLPRPRYAIGSPPRLGRS